LNAKQITAVLEGKNKKEADQLEWNACKFSYCDATGETHTKTIKNLGDIDKVKNSITEHQMSLEQQKNEVIKQHILLKMERSTSIDDLNQRVGRSASNDALLRGFDIEKMLEKASSIANKNPSFRLSTENCSTKSMELLQTGAPSDVRCMFDWHQFKEGETIPSNMFLTNPQTVYSAAKTVENAAKGDPVARATIEQKKNLVPERSYNTLLNELAYQMTTETGVIKEPNNLRKKPTQKVHN